MWSVAVKGARLPETISLVYCRRRHSTCAKLHGRNPAASEFRSAHCDIDLQILKGGVCWVPRVGEEIECITNLMSKIAMLHQTPHDDWRRAESSYAKSAIFATYEGVVVDCLWLAR